MWTGQTGKPVSSNSGIFILSFEPWDSLTCFGKHTSLPSLICRWCTVIPRNSWKSRFYIEEVCKSSRRVHAECQISSCESPLNVALIQLYYTPVIIFNINLITSDSFMWIFKKKKKRISNQCKPSSWMNSASAAHIYEIIGIGAWPSDKTWK